MTMTRANVKQPLLYISLWFLSCFFSYSSSQRTCPNCGSIEVPYPLSTNPNCGDPDYTLRCDPNSQKLYFDALNGSSYLVLGIMASFHRMVVQPSPWLPGKCITQDMAVAEHSEAFSTWIQKNLQVDGKRDWKFNGLLHLNQLCKSQLDCSGASKCSSAGKNGVFRCLCRSGYYWDHGHGTCLKKENSKSGRTLKFSIGIVSFFTLAAVMAAIKVRKSIKISNQAKLAKAREDMLKSSNGGKSARMFSLKEVKKATNGFSKDRILGSGGFGEVYKGELPDNTIVAVKSAKVGNIKSTKQILNEVGILSQVNHKNLVRLLGCCVEAEQPLMIYEYISNGTLHEHLHGKFSTFLDWKSRLRIAVQTAEALAYLHSAAYIPIYHRDVKSTNILLDDDLNVKVADFGLSRLACPGLSHVSTCAQGTLGYLDPEYYRNYQLTDKSDVYSYGVVLLELLTSQKAIDFSRDQDDVNLVIYVSQRASNGLIMEVVDQRLLGEEPSVTTIASVKLFSDLALACLREKKGERPSMKDVVQELECVVDMVGQEKASNEVNVEIV
ncbi:hypothetical protein F0562_016860 [Nyssa sinensis]|uniref:Protein kinase domain-containing protein n=1 Tax=Nyssa sinensis TaxID=561372 RepID=A0A5J4ZFM1_9ASTE|nr:hypothetical protein F0562_016860 [Nyssa sinensis]